MDVDYRDTKKLARLLSDYVEQAVKLSRLYNIESGYTQSKTDVEIKRAAESLIKAHRKKHKETDVSAIQSVIKSGIKLIKDTIEMLENDSDPVQPCCSSVTGLPRQFTDMERQLLEPKWTQHNKYMNALFEHSKDAGKFLDDLLGKITSAICSQVSHHDCKTCAVFMEMGEWMIFEPLVIVKDADRTFRAYLKSGRYECSRTGLRIECSSDKWSNLHHVAP
ncbi:uncharacterized protein LOC127443040 [Myxocyprinus asiaticus]|uniref:uncharacterized protein LOC127443040 n=1 Tax=Myxocyprinus asiaticus TaxID=70543 RepID=UPI0022223CBB|nr:uncharacterized protein LOC127443040 [Myxocyprinus asiaticus]